MSIMTPYILVWSPSSRRMALLCNESNGNQDATMVMATQTKFGRLQLFPMLNSSDDGPGLGLVFFEKRW